MLAVYSASIFYSACRMTNSAVVSLTCKAIPVMDYLSTTLLKYVRAWKYSSINFNTRTNWRSISMLSLFTCRETDNDFMATD
jgi:hypothetical protein